MSELLKPLASPMSRPVAFSFEPNNVHQTGAALVQPISKADIKVDVEQVKKNLQETISRLNEQMRDGGRGLNFSVDSKLGTPVVLVRNSETGEVIRQIPNEVIVRVAHSIEDLKGILFNEPS